MSNAWDKQSYKTKWAILGFLGSLLLWASLSLFFILLTDFSHFQTLLGEISTTYEERGQVSHLYAFYLLPTILFSLVGFALGYMRDEIKKYTKASIGGMVGLSVGIVLKVLNDYALKMLTGKGISFLPQSYLSLEFIIYFVLAYAIGWGIGKFQEKK